MDPTRASALRRIARRHAWVAGLGLIAGALAGGIVLATSQPIYSSSASVLVQPIGADEINLPTEAQLARSTEVALAVAERIGMPRPTPASVDVIPASSVLVIRFEAATPTEARDGARAFAEAYLQLRSDSASDSIDAQIAALNTKIAELQAESADLNARIAALPDGAPDPANLRASLTSVSGQIADLTTRANELAVTTIDPGRVIGEPELPTAQVRPRAWVLLGSTAPAGALLGLGVAVLHDRLTRRVRNAADVASRAAITVLAELPGDPLRDLGEPGVMPARVFAPHHPSGRAFHRLRNEIVALLGPHERTLLVTAASPGPASTMVAANLAAALARAENDVILVGANVPEISSTALTLARLFDVADIPGLSDVLAGRTLLTDVVQRAPRIPRLWVVSPGGTASAGGLLQSEATRSLLRALASQARYLVVEAPSAASGADAQSLAGAADAAVLVVEAGQARHAQVVDAALQISRVDTRLLGAVVLPAVPAAEPVPRAMARGEAVYSDDSWRVDARSAMNAPTTTVRQIEPTRPAAPARDRTG